MNNAKVTVPREVADAIESFRKSGRSNAYITETAIRTDDIPGVGWSLRAQAVRSIPFDTLMAALINGYTVEKSAEEIAEDERKATYERIYRRYALGNTDYSSGICFTLNTLGIKIPGVNAPETEVSA